VFYLATPSLAKNYTCIALVVTELNANRQNGRTDIGKGKPKFAEKNLYVVKEN
jgi:hypothetical protein